MEEVMITKILTVISILLAIPTFGISLVVWLVIKYQYDKTTVTRTLINTIVLSYENNGSEEVCHKINNAAMPLLFDLFGGTILKDFGDAIVGVLPHPTTKEKMFVTMNQISDGRLLIKAKSDEWCE
jgi:hypothetical protein